MNTTESQPELPGKPRWFQYRLRTLLILMLLASIGLSWYAVKAQKDGPTLLTTSDDVARYRGHRYRVWFFDDKTGAIRGFSDVTLRPQESVRLEPVAGARMELQLQGFMRQSVSDGYRTVEQYDAVSYCLKHRGGGVEGAASIIWPSLDVQRRVAPGCNAIVFCLPVGPKAPEALAAALPKEFQGTPEEVEEAILACLPEYPMLFSEGDLASLYQILGPTRQTARWRERLQDSVLRIRAALVLALSGDSEATKVLCQEGRPESLALLPPSAPVLDRLVSVIAQDKPLPCDPLPWDCPAPDRRCALVPSVLGKYPRADLLPYAPQLLRRAEGCSQSWAKELRQYFGVPQKQ